MKHWKSGTEAWVIVLKMTSLDLLSCSFSGPFAQNKTAGQRGGPVKASATIKMNFPASNVHVSPSRVSPPVRSSSMREVHSIRGEAAEGALRPTTTHRTVSMSTQNLTDHRHNSQSYYHHQHGHQHSNKPRRSHSFNEMSTSGGSLTPSGYSSSSASSTGSTSSNTTDYPSKMSSHPHGYRTYPLRETASLQTLPSSASHGGNASHSHGKDGHLQYKHGSHSLSSHHHGHTGQIRSSSVRNIPSASGYIATTTMAATTSGSSTGQSGRPIFSQPISATAARVESVDIPTPPTTTNMAANMRDLSSSYPSHSRGPPRTISTSGHTHGGNRGENPKPSRRHLHKVGL